jgi:uncharacterized protein YabE (DUF348 family)
MRLAIFRWPVENKLFGKIFKLPYLLALCVAVCLTAVVSYFVAFDTVHIDVDGRKVTQRTLASTVEKVLAESAIKLNAGDEVYPGLKTKVAENTTIRITRAVPVYIVADGKERMVRTVPVSVKAALRRAGIKLGPQDRVSVDLNGKIAAKQRIRVTRVTTKLVSDILRVEQPVEYVKDKNLETGKRKTIQAGHPGKIKQVVKVVYEDGKETKRETIAKQLLEEPLKQIVAVGIRPVVYTMTTSRGRTVRYTKVATMRATAYYPGPESCGPNARGLTRTGKKAGYGVVAVDHRHIRLGTLLYIEGYGFAEAADTGSAIKGNRIDLCYDTYREAKMFGVRNVKVYFLAP